MVLGDFIVRGGRDVLSVLEGALVETHDRARHPLLGELRGLLREVEAFMGLIATEVRTLVLFGLLAEIFALDQWFVDLRSAGSWPNLCDERAHVLVTHCRCLLCLDLGFICVVRAFREFVGDAEKVLLTLFNLVGVRRRKVLAFGLVHVVTSEQWAVAGLENALFAVAVMVHVARSLFPIGVRRVLCWG